MRDFWPDFSRDRPIQRAIPKDADTPNMADLSVPWRSFIFFVIKNWFCRTDAEKEEGEWFYLTVVFCPGILIESYVVEEG